MAKLFLSTFLIFSFFFNPAYSKIVPENDLWIPTTQKDVSKISEASFNSTIDEIERIYKPIVKERGANLTVVRNWEDGTVNAYASQNGKEWKVAMFGGLARHKAVTQDGFAAVVCHELGHHLGGAPKYSNIDWASNEGQSDYFATAKCLRKYFEKDDNVALMESVKVPEFAVKKCTEVWSSPEEIAVCKRNAMAGMSLASLFKELRRLTKPLKFETPDTNVVTRTQHPHTAPQCRLDTYFQGSLCDISAYEDVSEDDEVTGVCTRSNDYKLGVRPLCWYKP